MKGPLRTVRASFPAYSSSLHSKPYLIQDRLRYNKFASVHLLVAMRVKQNSVGQRVFTTMHPIFQMMVVPTRFVCQSGATVCTKPTL